MGLYLFAFFWSVAPILAQAEDKEELVIAIVPVLDEEVAGKSGEKGSGSSGAEGGASTKKSNQYRRDFAAHLGKLLEEETKEEGKLGVSREVAATTHGKDFKIEVLNDKLTAAVFKAAGLEEFPPVIPADPKKGKAKIDLVMKAMDDLGEAEVDALILVMWDKRHWKGGVPPNGGFVKVGSGGREFGVIPVFKPISASTLGSANLMRSPWTKSTFEKIGMDLVPWQMTQLLMDLSMLARHKK